MARRSGSSRQNSPYPRRESSEQMLRAGLCSHLQPDSHAMAINSGSDSVVAKTPNEAAPPDLNPQRTITHPLMMLSTSDPLAVH